MSLPNIKDHGVIDGDLNKVSDSCAENLYKRIDSAKDLESFFPNIKYLEKKLKVFVYQHYNKIFTPQQLIITWVKSSIYKNDIIVNFLSLKPGTKSIWRTSNLRIIFIFGYLNFFIGIIGKILFLITKNLISMIFVKFIKKKNIVKSNRFNQVKNFHQDGVLFFPHNGVVTTGQPPSDHFYSSELNSPFHPSKIMHLEYDYRVNIEYEKKKMKKYLNTNNVHYERFVIGNLSWRDVYRFVIKIFPFKIFFQHKNIRENLIYYFIILNAYVAFKRYYTAIKPYKNSKIALVGYDILFPKELSLALDSLNIKTVAIEDRFVNIHFNNYSYIFDTILTISKSSTEIIKTSEKFITNNIFQVGQVRTDHFFENKLMQSKYKARVVVLDSHIEKDPKSEKFYTYLNWKNDISFRNEILSLAEHNPEIEFIFRGKNFNWYQNEGHREVILKTNRLSNVNVDTEFSTAHWRSYHLCNSADLIIARPTSLAEECVSKGLNLIVMDYGINFTTTVSKFYPEILKEYYCHSLEELHKMFYFWIDNKYVLTGEMKNKIKKEIFSNLTDGKVKKRIQKYLKKIYYS